MKDNNHIIRQSFLDIELPEISNSDELVQEIIDYCTEVCFQDIEEQFRSYESGYYQIDSLEIDLGSFELATWKDTFKKRFDTELNQKLERISSKKMYEATKRPVEMGSLRSTDASLEDKISTNASVKDKINTDVLAVKKEENEVEHYLKAYCFYLENGYFPWWYSVDSLKPIILDFNVFRKKEYLDQLLQSVKANNKSLTRFIMETPPNQLKQFKKLLGVNKRLVDGEKTIWKYLTKTMAVETNAVDRAIIFVAVLIENKEVLQGTFHDVFWPFLEFILKHPGLHIQFSSEEEKEDKVFQLVNEFEIQWPELKNKELSDKKFSFLSRLNKSFEIRTNQNLKEENIKTKEEKNKSASVPPLNSESPATDKNSLKQPSTYQLLDNKSATVVEKEGVYVDYAGIVLFHPYLPALFERLRLTLKGEWISEESKEKGVQLLAYISTGLEKCHEHKLLLFKYLCGLACDEYVPSIMELNAKEKEECKNLMKAVLDHWEVLKNTSLDGLREGFIDRDGKLILEETNWKLIVEQKAQDLLLQKLPWGIGTIKLPWMEQMIWVHWI